MKNRPICAGLDTVEAFVRERCIIETGTMEVKQTLFLAFEYFCSDYSIPSRYLPVTFGRALIRSTPQFSLGAGRASHNGKRYRVYTGLHLRPEWEPYTEPDDEDAREAR